MSSIEEKRDTGDQLEPGWAITRRDALQVAAGATVTLSVNSFNAAEVRALVEQLLAE